MVRYLIFIFLFSSCYVTVTAQIGQTKAYIIKTYEMCEIKINEPESLLLKCGDQSSGTLYLFDENSICNVMYYEIKKDEWYRNQVNLLLDFDGKYVGLVTIPLPKFPDKKAKALHYTTHNINFYYFDSNGDGDNYSDNRAVWMTKR